MEFLKRKNLTEREELLNVPVLHWMYFAKHIITFSLLVVGLIIAWLVLNSNDIPISEYVYKIIFILTIIFLLKLLWHIYQYQNIEYGITNKRLMIKKGVFTIITLEIPIDRIESIFCRQNLIGMLFNYGNLIINGIGGVKIVFYMVRRPYALRRKVIKIIEKNKAITIIHGDIPKPVKPEPIKIEDTYLWGTFVRIPNEPD